MQLQRLLGTLMSVPVAMPVGAECREGRITSRAAAAEAKAERKSRGIGLHCLPLLLLRLLLLRLLLLHLLLTAATAAAAAVATAAAAVATAYYHCLPQILARIFVDKQRTLWLERRRALLQTCRMVALFADRGRLRAVQGLGCCLPWDPNSSSRSSSAAWRCRRQSVSWPSPQPDREVNLCEPIRRVCQPPRTFPG